MTLVELGATLLSRTHPALSCASDDKCHSCQLQELGRHQWEDSIFRFLAECREIHFTASVTAGPTCRAV